MAVINKKKMQVRLDYTTIRFGKQKHMQYLICDLNIKKLMHPPDDSKLPRMQVLHVLNNTSEFLQESNKI